MNDKASFEFFKDNGFLLVKDVFDKNQLLEAYNEFEQFFRKNKWKNSELNSFELVNNIYQEFPKLKEILFNEKFFKAIKNILLEQVIWLPECALHHNRFINWHKDTTVQFIGGVRSHVYHSYPLIQTAIYFQENTPISFIKSSHREEDKFVSYYNKNNFDRIINKIKKILKFLFLRN